MMRLSRRSLEIKSMRKKEHEPEGNVKWIDMTIPVIRMLLFIYQFSSVIEASRNRTWKKWIGNWEGTVKTGNLLFCKILLE